ncbi:Os05g0126400 [Oryza sativa Japonica Group]|uniref:Os05g0126400 protein n=1 Tax=Oryza sativa subsp. japonica TaxID=39947 RepID=Q75IM2_ORYSJ|nr:unknown protein [Oryza sativa Japonica Group]BAH92922.1 Os05g0126400 [Oryza sativa Japonica Group]|eukprot:NP_001174194.1 Os05g0126400 [Oryza sativa Japonica Group]
MLQTLLGLDLCLLDRPLQQRPQRRTFQLGPQPSRLLRSLRRRHQGRSLGLDGGKVWPSMRSRRCKDLQSLLKLLPKAAQLPPNKRESPIHQHLRLVCPQWRHHHPRLVRPQWRHHHPRLVCPQWRHHHLHRHVNHQSLKINPVN